MAINVILPRQGQSVETCIIGEFHKKKGDRVAEGEVIVTFETDKAEFDLESPASGVILEIFCKTGDEVAVLSNVAVIGKPDESIDEFVPKEASSTTGEAANVSASEGGHSGDLKKTEEIIAEAPDKIRISPRARNLASRLNIDVSRVKGTGPMGKILEKDIENAATALKGMRVTSGGQVSTSDSTAETTRDTDEFVIKKVSNVRRIIAEKMHASLKNSAQLTHHISANASRILEHRKRFKSDPEQAEGENITINDMVCYAVIKALQIKPELNSHFLGDIIKTFNKVQLGIAVDTERGLMVPALKNAGNYSLPQLSRALKSLADRCKNGDIDPELLAGEAASFTVSNLGAFGIEMFTPVLNLPQTGILGVNTIIYRPEYSDDGEIVLIPFIGLSLTYDHRAIDGAPASAFLKALKDQIENFDVEVA